MDSLEGRQKLFLAGVKAKKRSIRRKWMEINSLANAHTLILLPYHAMLSHVGQLIADRQQELDLHAKVNNQTARNMNCVNCRSMDSYDADQEVEEYLEVANS